jgi:RNA polymerase sigma-70 factor (ECF subfamily)
MLAIEELTDHILSARLEITSYVYSVTRDYHLAEDVYQEIFVRAVSQTESFESKAHLLNWFRKSARNRAIDLIRGLHGRYTGLSEETLAMLEANWNEEREDIRSEPLARCLQALTPRSREILKMQYFENRSSSEIAEFIGVKVESTYQAISRIHRALKSCIQEQLGNEASVGD